MIASIVMALIACLGLGLITLLIILIIYASDIKKLLAEPMLRYPIVIFESDDWGVGPLKQEAALEKISLLLSRFNDSVGNHPVMTLGLILAEPDTDKIKASHDKKYHKKTLANKRYGHLLKIINQGREQGIYTLQLHGMEHFWPASIMQSYSTQLQVKQWLLNTEKQSEGLPSELQSRWVDSSTLPSTNHNVDEINNAIDEEISLYTKLFGNPPKVIVPPTFVWTDAVSLAYSKHNIEALITPGRQGIGRDAQAKLIYNDKTFYNGEESAEGLLFLVRNNYFEPSLGHKAKTVIQAIHEKTQCARPALLEIHRFNFINQQTDCNASLQELEILLQIIQTDVTDIRFISTEQLTTILKLANQGKPSGFIVSSSMQRFKIAIARIKLFLQFKRIAKYSGINLLLKLC